MNDIHSIVKGTRVLLCKLNKRGNPRSGAKDITDAFMDAFVTRIVTDKKHFIMHTALDGKKYSINVTEMTAEEVKAIAISKKQDQAKAVRTVMQMSSLMDSLFNPPFNIE